MLFSKLEKALIDTLFCSATVLKYFNGHRFKCLQFAHDCAIDGVHT